MKCTSTFFLTKTLTQTALLKTLVFTFLLTNFSATTLFGATEHDFLKELADSYQSAALRAQTHCDAYVRCIEKNALSFSPCKEQRKSFLAYSQILSSLHRQATQECTPAQLISITRPFHQGRFNLLEPQSPQHFRDALFALKLTKEYNDTKDALEEGNEELSWRRQRGECRVFPSNDNTKFVDVCASLTKTTNYQEYNYNRLRRIFRSSDTIKLVSEHVPEFYETHPDILDPVQMEQAANAKKAEDLAIKQLADRAQTWSGH